MWKRWLLSAGLLLAPTAVLAVPIIEADFFGSSTRWKINDCSQVASNEDCSAFQAPIIPVLPRVDRGYVREVGPPMTVVEASTTVFAETTFTGLFDTPVVRGSVFAGADGFGLADVRAYQTYAYDGTDAVEIEFGGTLDYSFSGQSPVSTPGDSRPGDGAVNLSIRVFDLAGAEFGLFDVGGGNTRLIVQEGPATQLASAEYNSFFDPVPLPNVAASFPVFSSLTVQPGQELLFEVVFQASGDRGGFTDAANTFSFEFRNAPDMFFENLTSGTEAARIPEPSTLVLLGLSLAGLVLGRKRYVA